MSIASEVSSHRGRSNYKQQVRRCRCMSHGFCDTGEIFLVVVTENAQPLALFVLMKSPKRMIHRDGKWILESRDY